jgi:hypothetical protein
VAGTFSYVLAITHLPTPRGTSFHTKLHSKVPRRDKEPSAKMCKPQRTVHVCVHTHVCTQLSSTCVPAPVHVYTAVPS